MSPKRPLSDYPRKQLYDLVWSTPVYELAPTFGISNTAIAKHCKKLNVPRPGLGYWAKVAAGQTPPKTPLPPPVETVGFEIIAKQPVGDMIPLPANTNTLHPLAAELAKVIPKAELDTYKRAQLRVFNLPQVCVSKIHAERVAKAFHTILENLAPLGIIFTHTGRHCCAAYFRRQCNDRLVLTINEDLLTTDGTRIKDSECSWRLEIWKPCGYLTFSLSPRHHSYRDVKHWSESDDLPLEKLLAQLVTAMRKAFLDAFERRQREAIEHEKQHAEYERRQRQWQKEEAVRRRLKAEKDHADAIAAAIRGRKGALRKAAENWRAANSIEAFLDECELRWKSLSNRLTPDQVGWLAWARDIAKATSPFTVGYPDPVNDGAFDEFAIDFGGPYPPVRDFT